MLTINHRHIHAAYVLLSGLGAARLEDAVSALLALVVASERLAADPSDANLAAWVCAGETLRSALTGAEMLAA